MVAILSTLSAAEPTVDLTGYHEDCGVAAVEPRLPHGSLADDENEAGQLSLALKPGRPLIRSMGIVANEGEPARAILERTDPVTYVLVGRARPRGPAAGNERLQRLLRLAGQTVPSKTILSQFDLKRFRVTSHGYSSTIAISEVTIGTFSGELHLTLYAHSRSHSRRDRRPHPGGPPGDRVRRRPGVHSPEQDGALAWTDTEGQLHREEPASDTSRSTPGCPASHIDRGGVLRRVDRVFPTAPSVLLPGATSRITSALGLVRPRPPGAG